MKQAIEELRKELRPAILKQWWLKGYENGRANDKQRAADVYRSEIGNEEYDAYFDGWQAGAKES